MMGSRLVRLGKCMLFIVVGCACGTLAAGAATDTAKPDATALLAERNLILDDILGLEQSKNVCLIDPHQMAGAADLPGRLVVLSDNPRVSSETLRYCFRVKGAKITTQTEQLQPVRHTMFEVGSVKSASLLSWIGTKVESTDLAEIRTTPLPAVSVSVEDLDEDQIQAKLAGMSSETRRGLGIILSVVPYEAYASVCKKVNNTRDVGIWYIHVNNNWYAKNSDEVRRNYMVAIYTPIAFYDDLGLFQDTKAMSEFPTQSLGWQPPAEAMTRAAQLRAWNRERGKVSVVSSPGKVVSEQKVGL